MAATRKSAVRAVRSAVNKATGRSRTAGSSTASSASGTGKKAAKATSTKKAYSTSITTVGPNAFVLDSLAASTHLGGHTPGPGQTELAEQDLLSVAGHVSQYETAPTGGTVPISGTLGQSQARIAHVVIALGSLITEVVTARPSWNLNRHRGFCLAQRFVYGELCHNVQ